MFESLAGIERPRSADVASTSHHYIVLSQLNRWLHDNAVPYSRGVLLDFGCGGQPYRALFSSAVSRYVGADVAAAAGVSLDVVLTPGMPVPLADRSVDTILSTQTVEHVFDVRKYLNECRRLLSPRGRLVMTAPMHWRQHEIPFDYWRFTRFAIERLMQETGFSPIEITPCGGAYSVLGQAWLDHLNESGRCAPWLSRLVSRVALALDRRYPDADETLLWMCIAEKA